MNATSRHELISDNDGNVIGLMIRSTKEEDSLSVYSCVIESDGQTYRSANATLYVGGEEMFCYIYHNSCIFMGGKMSLNDSSLKGHSEENLCTKGNVPSGLC